MKQPLPVHNCSRSETVIHITQLYNSCAARNGDSPNGHKRPFGCNGGRRAVSVTVVADVVI
jgi:hypothetical protein